jgi:sortase A
MHGAVGACDNLRNPSRAIAADGSLGRIEVRRIGPTAMIVEGRDTKALQKEGLGTLLARPCRGARERRGRRASRYFFRALRNIRKDDEITLTTLNGTYTYRVDPTQVVEPNDTEVISASANPILTLVTCYPFHYVGPAPERLIVRAHRSPL